MEPPRMANPHFFPFFYQDFLFGTRFFTFAMKGLYLALLCEQWELGIITKSLFAKFKEASKGEISTEDFNRIRSKFSQVKGGFQNKKVEEVRNEVTRRTKIAKQNGSLGGKTTASKRGSKEGSKAVANDVANDPPKKHLLNLNLNLNSNPNIKTKTKDSLSPEKKSTKKPPSFPWPDDFTLTIHLYDYAKKQGIPNPEEEFENFRLNAMAKSYVYADWSSAWMKWCRDDRTNKKSKDTEDYFG